MEQLFSLRGRPRGDEPIQVTTDGTTWQTPAGAQTIDVAGTSTVIPIAAMRDQVARL
jgi:hypothetical protein